MYTHKAIIEVQNTYDDIAWFFYTRLLRVIIFLHMPTDKSYYTYPSAYVFRKFKISLQRTISDTKLLNTYDDFARNFWSVQISTNRPHKCFLWPFLVIYRPYVLYRNVNGKKRQLGVFCTNKTRNICMCRILRFVSSAYVELRPYNLQSSYLCS